MSHQPSMGTTMILTVSWTNDESAIASIIPPNPAINTPIICNDIQLSKYIFFKLINSIIFSEFNSNYSN